MLVSGVEVSCLNEDNKHMFFVYGIRNKITNKYYIGSSVNKKGIICRIRRHIGCLRGKTHHSLKLQRSYNKYDCNIDNWEFILFEQIDKMNNIYVEQIYINKYNSYHNGYNSSGIAGKVHSGKMSDRHRKAISDSKQNLTDLEVIDIFSKYNSGLSYLKISKYYNVSSVTISTIINNEKYYTNTKKKFKLTKDFFNYIFYNKNENKFYKAYNFNRFCKENNLNHKMMLPLYLGKFKKQFIDGWTVFNKINFSLKALRERIHIENKMFILYKDNVKIEFKNVCHFCEENRLNNSHIYRILDGRLVKYKGYTLNR